MSALFIETIRFVDGVSYLAELHAERFARTVGEAFGIKPSPLDPLAFNLPDSMRTGVVKCRVVYGREVEEITFSRYEPRPVSHIVVVEDNGIDYHLKYADRSRLEYPHVPLDPGAGVIIVRDGHLTDATYANLLLHAGDRLYTPDTPLLPGVMRSHLIKSGIVEPVSLTVADLHPSNPLGITHLSFINAMLPPGTFTPIPITRISSRPTLK